MTRLRLYYISANFEATEKVRKNRVSCRKTAILCCGIAVL